MRIKKALILIMVFALALGFTACGGNSKDKDILIGVSIWSSTDTLGSQVKTMLDAAAEALGVNVMYVDQSHISEEVTASMETLAAAGADGVIICNSSSAEMTSVINTANENKVYVAQFFRYILEADNPDEYALAKSSPYYVGAVHEDEVDNGRQLVLTLADRGYREIGLMGWEAGDATFLARWEGYQLGVEEWNKDHADDPVVLLEPQYGGTTSDTGRATAEAIFAANPNADAIIPAGGGGDPLIGAIAAIEGLGRTGEIGVASTDFLHDLDVQLEKNAITVESGGHFADPLFAFMMVYNAIKGEYKVPTDGFYDVLFPYIFVSSSEEYSAFEKYFIDDLPYNKDELVEMSKSSFEKLSETASILSIDEVKGRR